MFSTELILPTYKSHFFVFFFITCYFRFLATGKYVKLVKISKSLKAFKKQYNFPVYVYLRYVTMDDLALLQGVHLVPPMVAIIEGLNHYRLSPFQCDPNVFRIVMGMAKLNEKLGTNLTTYDISFVYKIQRTEKNQYTLKARKKDKKSVNRLLNSSKGYGLYFLVIIGNWLAPLFNCSISPGILGPFFFFLRSSLN